MKMMNKITIVLLICLLALQFFYFRTQFNNIMGVINTYNINRFVSSLGYFEDLEKRMEQWKQRLSISQSEIEYEVVRIQQIKKDFQEIVDDYNKIHKDSVIIPNTYFFWLQELRSMFKYLQSRETGLIITLNDTDLGSLEEHRKKLRQVNNVSKEMFKNEAGLNSTECNIYPLLILYKVNSG
jgi:predicted transcriptional regulator